MGRPKGTGKLMLNNGVEEWHEFCTQVDALAYAERQWCSAEDVDRLWPEMDNNDGLTLSEIVKRMESIEDTIERFNGNLTLMEAIKGLTQQKAPSKNGEQHIC
jgi:hypothetical protein